MSIPRSAWSLELYLYPILPDSPLFSGGAPLMEDDEDLSSDLQIPAQISLTYWYKNLLTGTYVEKTLGEDILKPLLSSMNNHQCHFLFCMMPLSGHIGTLRKPTISHFLRPLALFAETARFRQSSSPYLPSPLPEQQEETFKVQEARADKEAIPKTHISLSSPMRPWCLPHHPWLMTSNCFRTS